MTRDEFLQALRRLEPYLDELTVHRPLGGIAYAFAFSYHLEGAELTVEGTPIGSLSWDAGRINSVPMIEMAQDGTLSKDALKRWARKAFRERARYRSSTGRPDNEDDDDETGRLLQHSISALEAGLELRFGDDEETTRRQDVLEALGELRAALGRYPAAPGIGHNHPPLDENSSAAEIVAEVQSAAGEINEGIAQPVPDALKVAQGTTRLFGAKQWLSKHADLVSENFAKSLGSSAGKALGTAAGAAILTACGLLVAKVVGWLDPLLSKF